MVIEGVIIAVLVAIAYEDIRFRFVRIMLFPVLATVLILDRIYAMSSGMLVANVIVNLLYLCILLGLTVLYVKLRKREAKFSFRQSIGSGDLFFLSVLACWFDPVNFIIFITVSLAVALCLHLILIRCSQFYRAKETVPLAGFQSLCFLVVFVVNL